MGFVKFRHEYLYEHVNSENIPKLYDIVEKYLSNHLGTMGQWGDEWIIEGKLRGKIFKSLKSDRAVRFNWNIDATDNDINSIDIWENYGEKIKPIHRIELKNMSVTNGIQEIISYFNHPITESNSRVGIEDSEPTDLLDISDEELNDITIDVFEEIKERVMQVAYGYANSLIITGGSGLGKCHGKGTKIRMYDGSIKNVEDIKIGDLLMGDDSKPRKVLSLARGKDNMYKIHPISKSFDSFICNSDHILSLKKSKDKSVINISIKDYLIWSNKKKSLYKLYRNQIEYKEKDIRLDPYFLGLWLGDGSSNCSKIETMDDEIISYLYKYASDLDLKVSINENKKSKSDGYKITNGKSGYSKDNFIINELNRYNLITKRGQSGYNNKKIPRDYLFNSINVRKKLLAGLIDSDGYQFAKCYEISSKNEELSNQIKELSLSLGYSSWIKEKIINDKIYYIIRINGDLSDLPILLERKKSEPRKQIKDVKHSGFSIEKLGMGDYYGFTLDGNSLYCLYDYIITHNTYEVTNTLNKTGKKYVFIKGDITTAGLYQLLFSRRDELIVFDDCDAVLKEVDPNILKAALDSYSEREVSRPIATYFDTKGMSMEDIMANYHGDRFEAKNKHLFKIKNKGKMPRSFKFTGRVIFISNLKQDQIDPNYITRATASIDVNLTHEEVITRLNKVMVKMKPEVPNTIKQEVIRLVDYLTMNYITRHPLNIRTVVNAISTRLSNDKRYVNLGGKKVPLWQVLIKQDLVGKKAKRRPKDEDVVSPEGAETIS